MKITNIFRLPNKKIKTKHRHINLYYFKRVYNFGDMLNENIIDKLFGFQACQTDVPGCDLVAIGSLLQDFITNDPEKCVSNAPHVHIWGSGFICPAPQGNILLRRQISVHAVRGQLTLKRLRKYTGNKLKHVVLGDPGLLANHLIDVRKIKKKYDLGIIPHYVDKDNPLLDKIDVKNAVVIDIQQNPIDFLKQVAQCKNIISSAMHGLIAADALGIPNVRMVLSDKIIGGDYKYDDYYSAFGIKEHRKIDLAGRTFTDIDVSDIGTDYPITRKQVNKICRKLIKAFPYRRRKTWLSR